MNGFMLDTNAVSAFVRGRSKQLDRRVADTPPDKLCISIITFGETTFGLAKRPGATTLAATAHNLFGKIEILDFDIKAGKTYGALRAMLEASGRPLSPLDMLIAAHALSVGATLVSNDRAFRMVPDLQVEDWMQP
jgi:tRNA(fMet)-specific endonuclease VapC